MNGSQKKLNKKTQKTTPQVNEALDWINQLPRKKIERLTQLIAIATAEVLMKEYLKSKKRGN